MENTLKIQTFINTTLWKRTKQLPIENEIKKRWWIGHTLMKHSETITRQVIAWNPQGRGDEKGRGTSGKDTRK